MTPDAIRARLDAYAAEDPELFAAVRAVLHRHQPVSVHGGLFDVCAACCCDRSGQMTSECVTYHHHAKGLAHCHDVKAIAAALGVAEPAQPTERECDHDLCEDGACTKYGQPPVSAQAELRVWRVGDRVQWLRYSDDTITDTGTVVERDTQQWPGHVPVLPDYYRDGPHPMTHPVYIAPEHLSEVTDQAGEA